MDLVADIIVDRNQVTGLPDVSLSDHRTLTKYPDQRERSQSLAVATNKIMHRTTVTKQANKDHQDGHPPYCHLRSNSGADELENQ